MLTQEWCEFLENGVALTLGCCDTQLKSKGARCIGAVVGLDRKTVTFYIQNQSAQRVLPLLEKNKKVAVVASLPSTYKTLQLKGIYISHRDADQRDRIILERYRELFFSETDKAGVPGTLMRRMISFPAMAVDIEIAELYLSTPGQNAGAKL